MRVRAYRASVPARTLTSRAARACPLPERAREGYSAASARFFFVAGARRASTGLRNAPV
jgi:hypothetical protein